MDAPLAQTPVNFGPKGVFGKLLPVPKLCKNSLQRMCIYDDENKRLIICNAKFGDLAADRNRM